MKRWRILLLTVLIVAAGAFLPDLMLTNAQSEGEFTGRQVEITSESSSDYAWRMERISEHYFGEGLLLTYISSAGSAEDTRSQFLEALELLTKGGIAPEALYELVNDCQEYQLNYFYLFDTETIGGFRIAEFSASGINWQTAMCMDMESGKIAKLEYGGSKLIPDKKAIPESSWYDVLRGYGDYLGLANPFPLSPIVPGDGKEITTRQYYDNCTAERWAAGLASGTNAWMELRVLRENYQVTIAVYDGGR